MSERQTEAVTLYEMDLWSLWVQQRRPEDLKGGRSGRFGKKIGLPIRVNLEAG